MNVFIEPSGRLIEPFGDPPGAALIHNRPLSEWQAEAIAGAGLTVVGRPTPPCLILPDAALVTASTLQRFIEAAGGRSAVLVLKASLFGRYSTPVQPHVTQVEAGWRFERIRIDAGDGADPVDALLDPEEQQVRIPVPAYYMGTDFMEFGLARHPVMTLHHWVHILWANQAIGGMEALTTPKWKWMARLTWAAMRALSLSKWKVLGKMNTIGKGCDIHPTAVVEGSTLGDGVSVGPHARIRFSTVGSNTMIMGGAQVEWSMLGEKTIVSQMCAVNFCVLYPEAVASQYLMQLCLLGRRAITTGGAFSMDLNFEGSIRVPLDGQLHSTGQRLLGSAFGHECRVGTGFWMASGRMVPNGYFLIRDPELVLHKLPTDLGGQGPLKVAGRILEPLTARAPSPPPSVDAPSDPSG